MRVPVALFVANVLVGCQCMPLTEHYADAIDCISDHECHGEVFYHPGWDLQRIGHADWCRFRLNRWLCPCRCRHAAYVEAHRDRSKEVGQLWNQTVVKRSTPASGPAPGQNATPRSDAGMYGEMNRVPPEPLPEQRDLDLNLEPDGSRSTPDVPPAPADEPPMLQTPTPDAAADEGGQKSPASPEPPALPTDL